MIEIHLGERKQTTFIKQKKKKRKPAFWTESKEIIENFGLIVVLKILKTTVSIKLFMEYYYHWCLFILLMEKSMLALCSVYWKGVLLTPAG